MTTPTSTTVRAEDVKVRDRLQVQPQRVQRVVDWKPAREGRGITFIVEAFIHDDGFEEYTYWRDQMVVIWS